MADDASKPVKTDKMARIEKWVWHLIYGGLFAIVLGTFTLRDETAAVTGWTLIVAGAIAVVAGVALLYARSRMRED